MSRNLEKYAIFNKTQFFFETKKLTVGKILDLYTTDGALLNARLRFSSHSLLFFFDFLLQTVYIPLKKPRILEFMYYVLACIGMYYIAIHELGDHISEKTSTSYIRIGAAMFSRRILSDTSSYK